jgi:hypothetical protein
VNTAAKTLTLVSLADSLYLQELREFYFDEE